MSLHIVGLSVLLFLVTYPSRVIPMVAPGIERLPQWARDYLQLVGPAVLATLAAVTAVVVTSDGSRSIHVGVVAAATLVCAFVVVVRKNLLLGLTIAALLAALVRL